MWPADLVDGVDFSGNSSASSGLEFSIERTTSTGGAIRATEIHLLREEIEMRESISPSTSERGSEEVS